MKKLPLLALSLLAVSALPLTSAFAQSEEPLKCTSEGGPADACQVNFEATASNKNANSAFTSAAGKAIRQASSACRESLHNRRAKAELRGLDLRFHGSREVRARENSDRTITVYDVSSAGVARCIGSILPVTQSRE